MGAAEGSVGAGGTIGTGLAGASLRRLLRCRGGRTGAGRNRWWRSKKRLVGVQHQEREEDRDENAFFHLLAWHRVVASGAQRLAPHEPSKGEPAPPHRTVKEDGVSSVIGAGRNESAGAGEVR